MPFDVIIGTCAPEAVPLAMVGQLAEDGRMMLPVRFVPMIHPPEV